MYMFVVWFGCLLVVEFKRKWAKIRKEIVYYTAHRLQCLHNMECWELKHHFLFSCIIFFMSILELVRRKKMRSIFILLCELFTLAFMVFYINAKNPYPAANLHNIIFFYAFLSCWINYNRRETKNGIKLHFIFLSLS